VIDRGIINLRFKREILTQGNWDAPISDLNGFQYRKNECPRCNKTSSKFAITPERNVDYSSICIECISSAELKFSHDTEFGILSNRPIRPELADMYVGSDIPKLALKRMSNTPEYYTIQGLSWLCHCNDFMVYKGTWEPIDFRNPLSRISSRELFVSMTEVGNSLWDDLGFDENETEATWPDILYHSFECRHCKCKRGKWES